MLSNITGCTMADPLAWGGETRHLVRPLPDLHLSLTNEWQLFDFEKDPGKLRSIHADPFMPKFLKK